MVLLLDVGGAIADTEAQSIGRARSHIILI